MARIDGTHHAFKRKSRLGPGPLQRAPIAERKKWKCEKKKGTKYVQVCRPTGGGKPRIVKTDKAWKKAYNKKYRAWAKRKKVGTGPAKKGYRCRPTTVSKCR